ncbi:MAG: hypothetical protein A2W31_02285 [Planctomycetes bacterium RBG_16_64_10]|nr:MAG: hypothetical protein A2W31_02285 [Planctomycetes bacterium RBG_16_64_10]
MTVALIVAMSDGGVIGRAGGLPWHLPADLAHFKALTMGHVVIMGRKTFESIGRPLPGRTIVVVTRQPHYHPTGVVIAANLPAALRHVADAETVFIAGGAQIYRQTLPLATRMYVTRIHAPIDGDVRFPDFELTDWQLSDETRYEPDGRNTLPYSFQIYERRSPIR